MSNTPTKTDHLAEHDLISPKENKQHQKANIMPNSSLKKGNNELKKSSTLTKHKVQLSGWDKILNSLEKGLDSNFTQIFMGIVTIYALFGDDIRTLSTNQYGDPYFWGFNIATLSLFAIEILITSIVKKGYFNSFFFYLDLVSTVSLILDIGWISNAIFSTGGNSASNAASLAKAGRASRVGTKAGRVVRIIRLIRLVKLYKLAQQRLQQEAEKLQQLENEQNNQQENEEVEVGNKTLIQKKVNMMMTKERMTKNMQKAKQQLLGEQQKSPTLSNMREGEQPNSHPLESPHLNTVTAAGEALDKQGDENKGGKLPKLPPLPILSPEGSVKLNPSKPVVLDKYKNDPLLQATHLGTEQIDSDRKDPKKMAEDIIQINSERRQSKINEISKGKEYQQEIKEEEEEDVQINAESKVGQRLSDLTTQRVIIIVLCIMISIPLFDISTYSDTPSSYDNGLNFIYQNYVSGNNYLAEKSMSLYLSQHNSGRNPILYITMEKVPISCCSVYPNLLFNDQRDRSTELRSEDMYYYTYSVDGEMVGYAILDIRGDNNLNSILSIIRTVFVSVVLSVAAILFSSDVERLVLTPIENMMQKVKRIAENPLEAAQIEEREALAMEQLLKDGNTEELKKIKEQEGYETVVLEKLIIKIGALLALGFGEAGSEIIASNMKKGGDVDPMIPGKKMMAIFGFCDIRNFTDATEVLQTGVMLFVNEIAEITHSTVDSFLGQSNKNIGDAFLLVWKYQEEDYFYNTENQLELKDNDRIRNQADLPVLAFLKIMAAITISKKLNKYRTHKGLNERLQNYRVKMGFGLHVGWAIEGAIGSNFKIDASYLSPNVNMASRLEAATKQFGTGLLISGPLYQILSKKCQSHLRHIDRVTVKGSIQPLDMYTVDVHLDNVVDKKAGKDRFDNAHLSLAIKKKHRVIDRLKRNKFREAIQKGKELPCDKFETDRELAAMREFFTKEFYDEWKVGFDAYLTGKWQQAKLVFEKTLVMLKSKGIIDGPSNTLLEVIGEHGGKAPSDWNGYRALTEK